MSRVLLFGIIAALELTSLPSVASAQLPSPSVGLDAAAPGVTQPLAERDPHRFLALARQQVQLVPTQNLSGDGKKKLKKLHDDLERLATEYDQHPATASDSRAAVSAKSSAEATDWKSMFAIVERDIVAILGAGPVLSEDDTPAVAGTSGAAVPATSPATAATPAQTAGTPPAGASAQPTQVPTVQPVGTGSPSTQPAAGVTPVGQTPTGSATAQPTGAAAVQTGAAASASNPQAVGLGGVAVEEIGVKNLDAAVRAQLEEVRKNVELFYDASNSVQRP